MQSPNTILTIADCRAYFPSITEEKCSDAVLQDMIDSALADVIEALTIDVSGGKGIPITQVFRWENFPQRILHLAVPQQAVTSITETSITGTNNIPPTDYVAYGRHITKNPGIASFYWFDKVTPLQPGFIPPVTVVYTPRDTIFPLIKKSLLQLVRMELGRYDFDTGGSGAFYRLASVKDREQEETYNADTTDLQYMEARKAEIQFLLERLQGAGTRVG